MYKKIFLLALVALLSMGGLATAGTTSGFDTTNAIILDGTGGVLDRPTIIKKVRYAQMGPNKTSPSLNSGDVVKWDVTSADGITVSACTATTDAPCGVLVSVLMTDDSAGFSVNDNYGWMAVGGYAVANIDTSEATAGQPLILTEQVTASLPYLGTVDLNSAPGSFVSKDIGTLISDPGADGGGIVWLNLN